MAHLPDAALHAVEDAVRAVVGHDQERPAEIAAHAGDLYVWTRREASHDVELVMPPGSVDEWPLDVCDVDDGSKHIVVDMWTEKEGRSRPHVL
jgi:hypothetical protein